MSGSRDEIVQFGIEGLLARGLSSASKAPDTGPNYRSLIPHQRNQERGLADMLLDSFHVPRALPPQLAALAVLLKTQAAERRRGTRENDPPLAA